MEIMNDLVSPTTAATGDEGAERYWWQLLLATLGLGVLLTIGDNDRWLSIGAGILVAAGIASARHRRVLITATAALVSMVLAVTAGEDLAMLPIVAYACFYLAYHEPLRTAVPVGSATAIALAIVVPLVDRDRLEPLTVIGVISVVLVPLLLGIVLQQQREQVRSRVEAATAAHAEQVRLAIARDLHDIVAHGLTAVAIQSGTAIHLFDSRPDQAKEALTNVNEASRAALTELRAMVGELRSTEESRPAAAADPIAAAIERISPTMTVTRTGDPLPASTPNTVRVALERVVGEALANVIAHGGNGPTAVSLTVRDDRIGLMVDNDQGPSAAVTESTGFGIIGMTERIAAVGGSLEAGPRPGGFTVTASIPRGDW